MYKMYDIGEGVWMWCREKEYPKNSYPLLQLSCSPEENYLIGTHKCGFLLYDINKINQNNGEQSCTVPSLYSSQHCNVQFSSFIT